MTRLLYVIAGEESGDILGGRLMQALRTREPSLRFRGIGGTRMLESGLNQSLFPMQELSLMGLAEVVPSLLRLARRLDETTAQILQIQPAAVVSIDAPGFALRIARRVQGKVPVIHYVAPQVWAWRKGRVKTIARDVDRLLCLLPFEPDFFRAAGMDARFVGHPVLESGMQDGDAAGFRARHGIAADATVVAVLPGSRGGEVARMLPVLVETLRRVMRPGLRIVVPALPHLAARIAAADWPVPPILVQGAAARADALAASTAALCKSGTATLEVALAGCPMLVAYRVNPITAAIGRRIITVRFASLVNLLAEREVAPEFLQERCMPELLAPALSALLDDPGLRAAQREGFRHSLALLAAPGGVAPSQAAADSVLQFLAAGTEAAPDPASPLGRMAPPF